MTDRVTRREFLGAAAAALVIPAGLQAQPRAALYNGIVLPDPWPPRRHALSLDPQRPPYLASPPATIDIDLGRQLFVDDFLIEESNLHRAFHRAEYHPASPVLSPQLPWERDDPYSRTVGTPPSAAAMVFSDGVFYDPAAREFKMWYMGGYQQHTAMATSSDGIAWRRPALPVRPGTNIVLTHPRDSSTVWLDHGETDPRRRFKMASYEFTVKGIRLYTSPNGVNWTPAGIAGLCGDRSTMFRNPFRNVWAFSLRADTPGLLDRIRYYVESPAFETTRWQPRDPVPWVGADRLDVERPDYQTRPQLYNLDAVAYESVMMGLFTMYRGERNDREKPNDICVAFSRDGFHWSRGSREPFLGVSETTGAWNWSNVQSAGGGCVVVGDRLYFYVSGRQGVPGTNMPGNCSTGLATLRRDGFASLSDRWPAGVPRVRTGGASAMTTRPVRFTGGHLFINARSNGSIAVEVLDRAGKVIEPFSLSNAVPVTGDSTRLPVHWVNGASLAELANREVRFRFTLSQADLFAFWVSRASSGFSNGFVAAGGPGYAGGRDSG